MWRVREFWASVEQGDVPGLAGVLGIDTSMVAPVLPALASWRARRRAQDTVDRWRYREMSKPLPGTPAETVPQPGGGRWLVLVPGGLRHDPWAQEGTGRPGHKHRGRGGQRHRPGRAGHQAHRPAAGRSRFRFR